MRPPRFVAKILGFSDKDRHISLISSPLDITRTKLEDYISYSVEFIHQQHVNMCGDACVQMLLSFFGKPYLTVLKNNRGIFDPLNDDDVCQQLTEAGLSLRLFPLSDKLTEQKLGSYLANGAPVMCVINFNKFANHWVLLTAKHNDVFMYHDPWKGPNVTLPFRELKRKLLLAGAECFISAAKQGESNIVSIPIIMSTRL